MQSGLHENYIAIYPEVVSTPKVNPGYHQAAHPLPTYIIYGWAKIKNWPNACINLTRNYINSLDRLMPVIFHIYNSMLSFFF